MSNVHAKMADARVRPLTHEAAAIAACPAVIAKPIRILHVIHSLIAGGVERQLIELLRAMKGSPEFENELVILSRDVQYASFWALGISTHFLPRVVRYDPTIFPRLLIVARQAGPDIVHSWGSMCSFYAAPVAKVIGAKFVNGFVRAAPLGLTLKDRDYFLGKLTMPLSDVVVSNSKAGLAAYGIPRRKGVTIVNGFDGDRIRHLASEAETRDALGITTRYVVGMVGSFSDRKDWDTFLLSARQIVGLRDDVTFVAVGDGPNLSRYKAMVSAEPHPCIKLTGLRHDIEATVQTFTVGVLLSNARIHGEGIANSIMEYMALGKPVIVTDCGCNREIVLDGQNGYVIQDGDTASLTARILQLLDNEALRAILGAGGRLRIEQEFSLDRMIVSYSNLYRDQVSKAPAAQTSPDPS